VQTYKATVSGHITAAPKRAAPALETMIFHPATTMKVDRALCEMKEAEGAPAP
jgi:hypothetical protein